MPTIKAALWSLWATAMLPLLFVAAILPGRRDLLIWGSRPLISFKYWCRAMQRAGWPGLTIMEGHYAIARRDDFDRYFEDYAPSWLPRVIRVGLGATLALLFVLRRGRVLHTSFDGFVLRGTIWWRLEAPLLRIAGVKTVVLPFGGDVYAYSKVIDISTRYGLLASYPNLALAEERTAARVAHWVRHADCIVSAFMIDGVGRWDVTVNNAFTIDTSHWAAKTNYGSRNGSGEAVRILHTPNHRGFKGTEFLIDAVEALRAEGLNVELVMLEKMPNEEVRHVMQTVDILAEQFIAPAYAFSGIEGMASGLPVLANLDHEDYTRVFRRYGFLDECPILSSPPERLRENLRLLIRNPELRRELGEAGRAYAEKYHSDAMAQYMFGAIYDRILHRREVDLINLFHPLKSEYNRRTPQVRHPLKENRLPADSPYWQC